MPRRRLERQGGARSEQLADVGQCPYNGWDGDYYRLTLGLITEHNDKAQFREERA